jgi:hypothetical protein
MAILVAPESARAEGGALLERGRTEGRPPVDSAASDVLDERTYYASVCGRTLVHRGQTMVRVTTTMVSGTSRRRATRIAPETSAVPHQSEIVALGAGFAGVAFHPRFATAICDGRLLRQRMAIFLEL